MTDTALLIIDMQVGNFSESNPIYNGNKLLTKVKSLITKGRAAQTPIFYVQNIGGPDDPDEYGTPGWEIQPSITPVEEDVIFKSKLQTPFIKRTCTMN